MSINLKAGISTSGLKTLGISSLIACSSGACIASDDAHAYKANIVMIANQQDSGQTWLDGGLGRFGYGNAPHEMSLLNEANLAYRFKGSSGLHVSTHLQAQISNYDSSVRELGLVEFEIAYRHDLDFHQQIRLKAGQFFLPTSMENIDSFWDSPYTINYSSLNSWIGEEFRPIGIDAEYRYHLDDGGSVSFAATTFGGNDSMGALLAFRGWSYGRQRSALGDVLALPPLASLENDQPFGGQRDDGTKPFGRDLDNDLGFSLRGALSLEDAQFKLTWVDNKGDTTLLHREYAWRTRFTLLGAAWQLSEDFELFGEAMKGNTTMGAGPGVDVDFYSIYALLSYSTDGYRISYRFDQFGIDDLDQMDQESNELGRSHTLALMWNGDESKLHMGLEALFLSCKRQRILAGDPLTFSRDGDSLSVSALLRYDF